MVGAPIHSSLVYVLRNTTGSLYVEYNTVDYVVLVLRASSRVRILILLLSRYGIRSADTHGDGWRIRRILIRRGFSLLSHHRF